MINRISSLIEHKIERDSILDIYKEEKVKRSFHVEQNEQVEAKRKAAIEKLRETCAIIRGTCPEQWKLFTEQLGSVYGSDIALDRRTPYDLLGISAKSGMPIDAGFYGLTRAYIQGQIEVIEAIATVLDIRLEPISKSSMTFKRKLLTAIRILIGSKQR